MKKKHKRYIGGGYVVPSNPGYGSNPCLSVTQFGAHGGEGDGAGDGGGDGGGGGAGS